jgi:hypothetical protein
MVIFIKITLFPILAGLISAHSTLIRFNRE